MFFENLVTGAMERLGQHRQAKREEAAQQSEREIAILSHLLNSPDPEIQAVALSGVLNAANPRKPAKGLAGFLGETAANPAMAEIQRLVRTPVSESITHTQGGPPEYLSQAPQTAALPNTSPTQPGAPPPAAPVPGGPPEVPSLAGAVGPAPEANLPGALSTTFPTSTTTSTISRPRQILPTPAGALRSPEEQAMSAARAAIRLGLSPEQAQQVGLATLQKTYLGTEAQQTSAEAALARAQRPTATRGGQGVARPVEGTLNGQAAFGVFNPTTQRFHDPDTGEPMEGFQPRARISGGGAGAQDLGDQVERVAVREFGMTTAQLRAQGPDGVAKAQEAIRLARSEALQDPVTTAGQRTTATVTAKAAAERFSPLTPDDARQIGVPVGVAPVDMEGVTLNTDQQVQILNAATQLSPALSGVKDLITKVFPAAGTLRTNLTLRQLDLSNDPNYRVLGQQLALVVRNANSVLANDPDRLTDADAERVQKALIDIEAGTFFSGDTRASALKKMESLQAQVKRVYDRLRAPIEQVEQNYRRRLSGQGVGSPPPGPPPAPRGPGRPSTFSTPARTPPTAGDMYRTKDGRYVRRLPDGTFMALNPATGQFDLPVTVR